MPRLVSSRPRAITMWDFSWLERRWPGAGYEDWDQALDELAERGYDAVRIDAYPHLLTWGPTRAWDLLPCWHFLDWGANRRTTIADLESALCDFIRRCRQRNIAVGLSTWFRQDVEDSRMAITDAAHHGELWVNTLRVLDRAGLLDAVLYVDLCNEWPITPWAPFFKHHSKTPNEGNTPESLAWMRTACDTVRRVYPQLPLTFSFWPDTAIPPAADGVASHPPTHPWLDFYEPHIWMVQVGQFYERFGYSYQKFDITGIELVATHAERQYRANPEYWNMGLFRRIDDHAALSRRTGLPLVTTECWAVVDYVDGPRLDWGWVRDVCELGVRHACASGRWLAVATSNFCGPQFVGMWRDRAWHRRLTDLIRSSPIDADLRESMA